MILEVPRETLVQNLTERLEQGGLGIVARKGEYILVLREDYPEQYPNYVDPMKPHRMDGGSNPQQTP